MWFYLWPYISQEELSDADRMEVFLSEKKTLAKEFLLLSLEEKHKSYRLTNYFFLKSKTEEFPLESEPEFLNFFREEIFMKEEKEFF